MCLLREIKRTGEIVKLWIQWDTKNDHTDPMEMSYLLGIAGGCLAAVLILVCLCIYAIRTRKCCFKGKFSICFLLLFQKNFFFKKFHHWISRRCMSIWSPKNPYSFVSLINAQQFGNVDMSSIICSKPKNEIH